MSSSFNVSFAEGSLFFTMQGDLSTMVQGLWTCFVSLNLTLIDRKMQVKFGLKVVMISLLVSKWLDFKHRGLQFPFKKQI